MKLHSKIERAHKLLHQLVAKGDKAPLSILFVVGCQRSGTSVMMRMFDKDLDTTVYGEVTSLTSAAEGGIRLRPLNEVREEISKARARFVIVKPLVESQNLLELLQYFEDARALWMFRHYKDVARSHLEKWGMGNGIRNLKPIALAEPGNWRSERVPDVVRNAIAAHYAEDMNPYDAAALFWFARNSLFFDLKLAEHPRVMMVRYEDLVTSPLRVMKGIYDFADRELPKRELTADVHSGSLKKGDNIELSDDVERLCRDLWDRINAVYKTQSQGASG